MIRLTEDVVAEIDSRGCVPAVSFVFSLRLQMWPVFQKAMSEHVDAVKKIADGASGGYFGRGSSVSENTIRRVRVICSDTVLTPDVFNRYATDI